MSGKSRLAHRFMFMVGLILAGEAVFALPFHLARFFRPTVLEVFQLTNTELGAAQGIGGAQSFHLFGVVVPHGTVGGGCPGKHAEDGDLSGVLVHERADDLGHKRSTRGRRHHVTFPFHG